MSIISSFIALFSGLAIFLIGVTQMSSGLEKVASSKIKTSLEKVSDKKYVTFGFGVVVTAIVQSSTAVTIMSISFLNAGLMTLIQAIAIIIGANIGTTLTGMMTVAATFDFSIYFSLFAIIGLVMDIASKKQNTKRIGQILTGLGLVFIGIGIAGDAFKTPEMNDLITNFFLTIDHPLLLVTLSLILTGIVQSSSLVVGLSIILASAGAIPLVSALFIVIGADVGTTFTGIIVAFGTKTNANAKRLSVVQFFFNLSGAVIFTILLILFTPQFIMFLQQITSSNAFQVAIFHTIFNVVWAILCLPFISQLAKLSYFFIKDDEGELNRYKLWYADEKLLSNPAFAITTLLKEVSRMFTLVQTNLLLSFDALQNNIIHYDEVKQNEETVDFLNGAISLYLVKLSSMSPSYKDELEIGRLFHIVNDLERISDHCYSFVKLVRDINEDSLSLSSIAQNEINLLCTTLIEMFNLSYVIFENKDKNKLKVLSELEDLVDNNRKNAEQNHVTRLRSGECSIELSKYFYEITSQLERIGDHLTNIGFSTVSVVGSQKSLVK